MGLIRKQIALVDRDTDRREAFEALFDTGAMFSHVSEEVAERFPNLFTRSQEPREQSLAVDGPKAQVVGTLTAALELDGHRAEPDETFRVTRGLGLSASPTQVIRRGAYENRSDHSSTELAALVR